MKKILILGASGFIGKNLILYLSKYKEFRCIGVYRKNFPKELNKTKLIKCDLTVKTQVDKLFKKIKPDIVINAAATTSGAKDIISKPYIHVNDNAIINSMITRSSFEANVKHLIIFSCTVMYRSSSKKLKEKDFDANAEMYPNYFGAGWMKVFVEKMSEFYSRISDTKYTLIRHSNVYGQYDKFDLEKSHVFGASITKVILAKKEVVVWGAGNESRDLIHIDDLMRFVLCAIKRQKNKFGLYNVGLSKNIKIKDLVKKIIKYSRKSLKIKYDLKKITLANNVKLDISKAKKELGWEPKIDINEGIVKTLRWYNNNFKN
jgi:GDP-L-fucose synthase